jgi:hypothetical protein
VQNCCGLLLLCVGVGDGTGGWKEGKGEAKNEREDR